MIDLMASDWLVIAGVILGVIGGGGLLIHWLSSPGHDDERPGYIADRYKQ